MALHTSTPASQMLISYTSPYLFAVMSEEEVNAANAANHLRSALLDGDMVSLVDLLNNMGLMRGDEEDGGEEVEEWELKLAFEDLVHQVRGRGAAVIDDVAGDSDDEQDDDYDGSDDIVEDDAEPGNCSSPGFYRANMLQPIFKGARMTVKQYCFAMMHEKRSGRMKTGISIVCCA